MTQDHATALAKPADPEEEPAVEAAYSVTLVEGSTFAVSGRSGDMDPEHPQGLFFRDTRVLATWRLRLGGGPIQVLTVVPREPFRATFLARVPPRSSSTELFVERSRAVGNGMREDLRVRNVGNAPVTATLTLDAGSDFADLFAVKEGRARADVPATATPQGDALVLSSGPADTGRGVRISAAGATLPPWFTKRSQWDSNPPRRSSPMPTTTRS